MGESPNASWAAGALECDLATVLPRLEAGMQVRLIAASPFDYCNGAEKVSDVVARFRPKDYDHIPVRDEHAQVIGVLSTKKPYASAHTARDAMEPLNGRYLLSGDAPLFAFIERADEQPYCLILNGDVLDGIVTLSDLQKLPVRPAVFLLITHLELLLAEWLRRRGTDAWLNVFKPEEQKKIKKAYEDLRDRNLALDPVTATSLAVKSDAAVRLGAFPHGTAESDLREIRQLRNSIAHAWEFANSLEDARRVPGRVRLVREYIRLMQNNLANMADQQGRMP
jgi:hypothetical protein